jgi:hypothetical protein
MAKRGGLASRTLFYSVGPGLALPWADETDQERGFIVLQTFVGPPPSAA